MSKQKRRHPRNEVQIDIKLIFLDKTYHFVTSSISRGGMFILCDNHEDFPLGELVSAHFIDVLDDNKLVNKDAIIVRNTDEGFAIAFVEIEDF